MSRDKYIEESPRAQIVVTVPKVPDTDTRFFNDVMLWPHAACGNAGVCVCELME
jgi:hypothetical protein